MHAVVLHDAVPLPCRMLLLPVAVYCVRSMEPEQVLVAALVNRCCSRAREAASGEAERCAYAI